MFVVHGIGDAGRGVAVVADMDGVDAVDVGDDICLDGNSLVQLGFNYDNGRGGLG